MEQDKTGVIVPRSTPQAIVDGIHKYLELKEQVDFESNVAKKIEGNDFGNIVEVFKKMLA